MSDERYEEHRYILRSVNPRGLKLTVIDTLVFHIQAQNATLLIRREDDHYIFETFEVSCPNGVVMGTRGRLQRLLPSEAITISAEDMNDIAFRTPFAEMLVKLDAFTPEDAYRKTRKATETLVEIRNTVDPRYFTEMVFGMLRGMGKPTDIPRVHKHVRDDVIWSAALTPWRRSPLWMILRVAMQTTFELHHR